MKFEWQNRPLELSGFSDSDWAGCIVTRKSTSGGCIVHGKHILIHYSSTQKTIALSSAEAELNGLIKMGQELLGLYFMFESAQSTSPLLKIYTDASAANGIVHRLGSGKVKHLSTRQLWLQQHTASGLIKCTKIPRDDNIADSLAHHWTISNLTHVPEWG